MDGNASERRPSRWCQERRRPEQSRQPNATHGSTTAWFQIAGACASTAVAACSVCMAEAESDFSGLLLGYVEEVQVAISICGSLYRGVSHSVGRPSDEKKKDPDVSCTAPTDGWMDWTDKSTNQRSGSRGQAAAVGTARGTSAEPRSPGRAAVRSTSGACRKSNAAACKKKKDVGHCRRRTSTMLRRRRQNGRKKKREERKRYKFGRPPHELQDRQRLRQSWRKASPSVVTRRYLANTVIIYHLKARHTTQFGGGCGFMRRPPLSTGALPRLPSPGQPDETPTSGEIESAIKVPSSLLSGRRG
ncbi:hypothetical protein MRX96_022915 [Rhipicephalus microplus]